MKTPYLIVLAASAFVFYSCRENFNEIEEQVPLKPHPESTTTVAGEAVWKVLPRSEGWMILKETLQPQLMVTAPNREITFMDGNFSEIAEYKPEGGWFLLDAVVHPSGQVTAAVISVDANVPKIGLRVKLVRIKTDGSKVETELSSLPNNGVPPDSFPSSLDRVKLQAFGEDVYVVTKWRFNEVQAHRMSFEGNQFIVDWQRWVEPAHYVGMFGIIGGGYDNFRQGDAFFFVYSGVDSHGNLYVAVPSTEELVQSHDEMFGENLMSGTNPDIFDFGVVILTKFTSSGERIYSALEGHAPKTKIVNMRVDDNRVYFVGRKKLSQEPNGWDAWVLAANTSNGSVIYDALVDIQDGDIFWDINPLGDGQAIAVGCIGYTQNPVGLSVSDGRFAAAVVLDSQGRKVKSLDLPQGPAGRGSEAMFVNVLPNGSVVYGGAHNAPGTHAAIFSDGFVAVRNLSAQQ